jgi:hypothetical protein
LCHFGPSRSPIRDAHNAPQSLTRTEISAKSNHSRTSEKFSRKSNYSRTYAKTGGWGGYLFSLSVLPSLVLRVYTGPVAVSSVVSPSCPAFSFSPLVCPACSELRGERSPRRVTRHSSLTPIIPAPLATAALPVVPAPIFTTTSRIHVGAPTIPFLDSTKDNPGTDLKIGHYMSKPKSTGKNACATKSMEKRNPRPPSQNEDGAPGIVC